MTGSRMRVACIGNMNNNLFALARYLRDRDIEADVLLLNTEAEHFQPSADTFGEDYHSFIRQLEWGDLVSFRRTEPETIIEDLEQYSVLIGSGPAPAFLYKAGLRLDMFVPYGADIHELPFFKLKDFGCDGTYFPKYSIENLVWQFFSYRMSRTQRRGLRAARHIILRNTPPYTEMLKEIGCRQEFSAYDVPILYAPEYDPGTIGENFEKSKYYQRICSLRELHDVIIFHHARHVWKNPPNANSLKGNDILFKGFAEFIRSGRADNPCLVTCEYGVDVDESKSLIEQLGIGEHVHWLPKIERKEIMMCLSACDIVAGEFVTGYQTGGTVMEALASGKPLMNYRADDLYRSEYKELYPLMNVRTSEDVANALADFVKRPTYYQDMGAKSRQWFQEYIVEYAVDGIVGLIEGSSRQ